MNAKIVKIGVVALLIGGVFACSSSSKSKSSSTDNPNLYVIETEFGNMTIRLFDETPLHRDNFKKLVADSFYNGTLFHRVIPGFMVQGGDPDSKSATKGQRLGTGNLNYTVQAEFVDSLIHKKGALAAARQPDQVNPLRSSSGSQFYIVQGSPVQKELFGRIEQGINNSKKRSLGQKIFNDTANIKLRLNYMNARTNNNQDSMNFYGAQIEEKINLAFAGQEFKYNEKQKALYDSLGGAPHLDGQYTVFGEVIEGLGIIDSIANCKKDGTDRPLEDVKMTIKKL